MDGAGSPDPDVWDGVSEAAEDGGSEEDRE